MVSLRSKGFWVISVSASLLLLVAALWIAGDSESVADDKELKFSSSDLSEAEAARSSDLGESLTANSPTFRPHLDIVEKRAALTKRLKEIERVEDYKERPGILSDLMRTASIGEVETILSVSDVELGGSLGFRDDVKAAAYERWYHLDPATALRAIDGSAMSPHRKVYALEVLLEDWAARKPDEVSAFLRQGELKGISIDEAYGAIARGASFHGALELLDAALSRIANPTLQSYAVRVAARNLQGGHGSLFEGWLAALPSAQRGSALAESAWILSNTDIGRSLANLERLALVEAERVTVTRERVVVKWAETYPAQAAEWVANQELEGEDREALFASVLSVWLSKDRDEAVSWVESLIEKAKVDEAFMQRVAQRW